MKSIQISFKKSSKKILFKIHKYPAEPLFKENSLLEFDKQSLSTNTYFISWNYNANLLWFHVHVDYTKQWRLCQSSSKRRAYSNKNDEYYIPCCKFRSTEKTSNHSPNAWNAIVQSCIFLICWFEYRFVFPPLYPDFYRLVDTKSSTLKVLCILSGSLEINLENIYSLCQQGDCITASIFLLCCKRIIQVF